MTDEGSPIGVNPGAEGILKALESMSLKDDKYRKQIREEGEEKVRR